MKTPEWHKRVYSKETLPLTIASPKFNRQAFHEARFIMEKLKLKKGESLLDIPCGTGRHSKFFSLAGIEVTGVDINPTCLAWAKRHTRGRKIQFQKGNMGDLSKFRGKFDALANLFTSFGYFETEDENDQVMREFVSTLKPGGRLALSLINKDWLLKVFQPASQVKLGKETIIEAREYYRQTSTVTAHWFHLNKNHTKADVYYNRVRVYSKEDMVELMKQCGLKRIKVFGSYSGDKFSRYKSSHPVYVGWKV